MKITVGFFKYLSLLSMLFLCTACPYFAFYPINSDVVYKPKLIGKWVLCSETKVLEGNLAQSFIFEKLHDNQYTISHYTWDEKVNKTILSETYTGYISKVGKNEFLNVFVEGFGYCYFKMKKKDDDNLIFYQVSEELQGSFVNLSQNDLKKFIEKNAENNDIYDEIFYLKKS